MRRREWCNVRSNTIPDEGLGVQAFAVNAKESGRMMSKPSDSTLPSAPSVLGAASAISFLAGGGQMGERMRALDWSKTALGAPEYWPQSLKTIVRVMLDSRYAMWML
jgi:hypothetical protein